MFLIQSKPITATATASAMVTITRKTFSIKFFIYKKIEFSFSCDLHKKQEKLTKK